MDVLGDSWIVVGGAPLQMTARVYTRSEPPAEFIDDTEHVTWSTDPAGVLTVDRQGHATAIASGAARVIATIGDRSARSPVITAVPDFSGTWSGNYIITGCSGAGDPRTCGRLMFSQADGSRILYPFSLTLSQLQDRITGTLSETSASQRRDTPVSGFVRLSGAAILEATVPQPDLEPMRITNWSMTLNSSRSQLSGAFTKIVPNRSFGGTPLTMRTEHEFTGVSRSQ